MNEMDSDHNKFENKVILVAILTGFIGSIIIFFLNLPPILVAVFLGTGIAALVYRFLGGTTGSSMAMGTLKLSGSIAVLLGSAYFINSELIKQLKTPNNPSKDKVFNPHHANWVAVSKANGKPIEVKIEETEEVIEKPEKNIFRNIPLGLLFKNNKYLVIAEDSLFTLGYLDKRNFKDNHLFNSFTQTEDFVVTERLGLGGTDHLSPFSFNISTTAYANEYSHFQLTDKISGEPIYNGRIYRRRFEIIKLSGHHYLIAVVEVNHQPKDPGNILSKGAYAKFAVARISAVLE